MTVQQGLNYPTAIPILQPETLRTSDRIRINPLLLNKPDNIQTIDRIKTDPLRIRDGVATRLTSTFRVTAEDSKHPDTLHLPDTFKGTVTSWNVGRSGAPDNDAFGDGWTEELLANRDVNHGNENLLIGATIAAARRGFFKANFTSPVFVNLSAPAVGGVMTFSFIADAPLLAPNATLTLTFSRFAASPFTESTVTHNNVPADGGDVVAKTVVLVAGVATQRYTVTLTTAEYSPYMSDWMMIRIISDALIDRIITSRDNAVAADRPLIAFDFRR